jgi:hypothetical protein
MPEYFVITESFAAPFFSDSGNQYVQAETPEAALETVAAAYGHPSGLYAAVCYASADAYHKGEPILAKWLSNHEIAKQEATQHRTAYSYLGHGPGVFEIDGQRVEVENPTGGRLVPVPQPPSQEP